MKGRIKQKEKRPHNLPILGKIKCGKKTSKGYPTSLDHFICEDKYGTKFHQVHGQKPTEIQIVFISDDWRDSCDERYELRDNAGDLYGKGDGETFDIWNPKNKEYESFSIEDHPDLMERTAKKAGGRKGWEVILTLKFILPKVRDVFGVWKFVTKGEKSSVPSIRDTFDMVQEQRGSVVGAWFDLTVEKVKSQKPGVKSVYPVVNLIPRLSEEQDGIQSVLGSPETKLLNEKQDE